jgi:hypothetical protein
MTPDDLFLCTLDDLENRLSRFRPGELVSRAQQYDLLMAAGLLRKLLIDGEPLVAPVNRTRRLRLRFSVSGWPFLSGSAAQGARVRIRRRGLSLEAPTVAPDQLTPELGALLRDRSLTLDEMLAASVVIWNDVPIDAKGLITYVANVAGGVHVGGKPRGRAQEALHDFGHELIIDGYPLALAALTDVAEVTVSGLRPLRAAISAESGDSVDVLRRPETLM